MQKYVFHSSLPPYVIGDISLGNTVTLRLRADISMPISSISLRSTPEGEEVFTPLHIVERDKVNQWWEGKIELTVPLLDYRFWICTNYGNFWLSASGLTRYTPLDNSNFKLMCLNHTPDWITKSVIYQIFPDRFCNGNDDISVKDGEYLLNGKPVERRNWDDFTPERSHGNVFFGGDLWGIIEKLDYLKDLGITALYLNPIFTSPSNHKYDVADYYRVDAHLGGDEALIKLREELTARDMRLILDIVPNHCGNENPWFKEAQRSLHSPEADFFTFRNHPNEYECWLGVNTLPRLNYASSLLRERMYGGNNAVMRYWLRPPFSIDGWRIDVANMLGRRGRHQLGHKIGRAIRQAVKNENSEAWILGEHFFDGTAHLQGDELDATMNYRGFTMPVLQWLCGRDRTAFIAEERGKESLGADEFFLPTEDFIAQLNLFRCAVPEEIAIQQANLLDSHDTPRFLTMARGNVELLKVAVTFMFTYQGVPCVYYGDEIGMCGGGDPDCRRPMNWDDSKWDRSILAHYKAMIALRRRAKALQCGCLQMIPHREGVAYLREYGNSRFVVALNRGENCDEELSVRIAGIADGTVWKDVVSGREAVVKDGLLRAMPANIGSAVWEEMLA